MPAISFEQVLKFNQNHDSLGRFASSSGVASTSQSTGYTKEDQIAAIADWSDGAYGSIRKAQMGTIDDPKRKAQAEAIESFIDQSDKYTGYLCRGISTDEPIDFKVGQKLDMNGVSSWSKNDEVGDEFSQGNEHSYLFVSQNLTRAADISMHTMNPGEEEVLVSEKTKFKVKSVEYDPDINQTIVVVEETGGSK